MSYILFFIFLLVLFIIMYRFPFTKSLPVLMYHSISLTDSSDLTVLQSELEKQLNYLKNNNYETIFYDEIDISKKQILITFDDGFVNNKDYLIPLLIKFNFKATIFIPFNFIGKKDEWWTNSQNIMTLNELKNLDSKYIQLGWHTYNHQSFKILSIEEIKNDFEMSYNVIKDNSLKIAPLFAYPFGNYPKSKKIQNELFQIFKDYGIKYAFRIGNKLNNYPFKNNYLLKRIDIRGNDSILKFSWKIKFGRVKPF